MKKRTLNLLQDLSLAYSTNKDYTAEITAIENNSTTKKEQKVRVELFTKLKGGKSLSRIYGLAESQQSLESLCKLIKNKCGLGGTVKDGEILIQGNQIEKIIKILLEEGYKGTKRSGG